MKSLLFTVFIILNTVAFSQVYNSPEEIPNIKLENNSYVSDPEGYLSNATISEVNEMCKHMDEAKGFQIAVVLVNSINNQNVLSFATELGNLWGVGKGDRGIVILCAIGDRNMAIATGEITEEYFPDYVCDEIQRMHITSHFYAENYNEGILNGVKEIERRVFDEGVEAYVLEAREQDRIFGIWMYFALGAMLLVMGLTLYISFTKKTAFIYLGSVVGAILITLIATYLLKGSEFGYVTRFVFDIGFVMAFLFVSIASFKVLHDETDLVWPFAVYMPLVIGAILSGLYLKGFEVVVYIYLAGAAIIFVIFLLFYLGTFLTKDLHKKYHIIKMFKLDVFSYVFPMPMYIIDMIVENTMERWRSTVRFSKKTGLEMRLLSEIEDDQYLSKGQATEEFVKSVDYDVWISDEPDDILILRYTTWFTAYSKCKRCKFKTWYLVYDKTIRSATYSSSGLGEKKKSCANCGYGEVSTYRIPKLRDTSSSSGGSGFGGGGGGGSSSGGSWGGGSFGGGGSSSSW